MALNNDLTQEFCNGFLGYGNPAAPLWFIGMEEGGGNSESEIAARFDAWEKRGKRAFEDLRAFCRETGHADLEPWASTNAPRQKTWCGLIKEKGSRENKPDLIRDPVTYQRTEWLTEGGETCLINLMPLPSPGTDTWNYPAWSNLPTLLTRKMYVAAFVEARINSIREAIQTHQPERVVFVGLTNATCWNRVEEGILDIEFDTIEHPASRKRNLTSFGNHVPSMTAFKSTVGNAKDKIMSAIPDDAFFNQLYLRLGITREPTKKHFQQLQSVSQRPVFVSFVGGKGGRLRLEWKLQQTDILLTRRVESKKGWLEGELGQKVEWLSGGAVAGSGAAIVSIYFDERSDAGLSQLDWATQFFPRFVTALSEISQ